MYKMQKQREHFSESSFYVVHYDVYQPIVQKIAPWFVKQGIRPNNISIARFITVVLITLFMHYNYYNKPLKKEHKKIVASILALLMIICGISDDLDGYIARKHNQTSKLGKKLDEMADFTTFVCMIYIASLYTGFPKIVIALGLGLWVYQMVEKNAFKNGYQISPTVNVLTHTWFIYAIVLAFFVLTH